MLKGPSRIICVLQGKTMQRGFQFFCLTLGALLLSACGQMGPLYLPSEKAPTKPISTNTKAQHETHVQQDASAGQ